eukprot:c32502_g1_i1 orf=3-203(+)
MLVKEMQAPCWAVGRHSIHKKFTSTDGCESPLTLKQGQFSILKLTPEMGPQLHKGRCILLSIKEFG